MKNLKNGWQKIRKYAFFVLVVIIGILVFWWLNIRNALWAETVSFLIPFGLLALGIYFFLRNFKEISRDRGFKIGLKVGLAIIAAWLILLFFDPYQNVFGKVVARLVNIVGLPLFWGTAGIGGILMNFCKPNEWGCLGLAEPSALFGAVIGFMAYPIAGFLISRIYQRIREHNRIRKK
ncbi:hypothetical protein HYV84_02855 [Candidatus Woesearchaeota archaeon]|nr:hypothetical protein [Candidatus Woesearchaeota archaeon]